MCIKIFLHSLEIWWPTLSLAIVILVGLLIGSKNAMSSQALLPALLLMLWKILQFRISSQKSSFVKVRIRAFREKRAIARARLRTRLTRHRRVIYKKSKLFLLLHCILISYLYKPYTFSCIEITWFLLVVFYQQCIGFSLVNSHKLKTISID